MAEVVIREILDTNRMRRVIIVRREDGRFTYRRQDKVEGKWGPATIDAGIYDSADSAETEARQREPWLRRLFH